MTPKQRKQTLASMMNGFKTLDQYWAENRLPFRAQMVVKLKVGLILLLKYTYAPIKHWLGKRYDPTQGLDKHKGFLLRGRGMKCKENDGGHYLTRQQIKAFEKTGIHGPFKVLEREQALALKEYSHQLYDRNFDGQVVLGQEVVEALEKTGEASINYLGLYQALFHRKLWDVLSKPELTHKLASLLGDDILCWRSQFFEKKPKQVGTFWHQAGTFQESSEKPKLKPLSPMDEGIVQLTAWIALSDTTIKNGCLRMLECSFEDGRLEKLSYEISNNKLDFMMTQPAGMIEKIIKTVNYTSGSFLKAQLIFEIAVELMPDLFEGKQVKDLEMKAGECIFFTSLNVHGSYPNLSDTDTRLALAGRFTSNDVMVYKDFDHDLFFTSKGKIKYSLDKIACMQVLGQDTYGHNKIANIPNGVMLAVEQPPQVNVH